jgi:hypothetical protein
MKIFNSLLLFLISLTFCYGQKQNLGLSDFSFTSIFGYNVKDTSKISLSSSSYCLLGTGFFKAPHSKNSDSIIIDWITKHPKAVLIPISAIGDTDNKTRITYCWITDSKDTLNNLLIRNGCFPGGTMLRPKSIGKRIIKGLPRPTMQVYINKRAYAAFIEQIKSNEKYAQDNQLGIWKDLK